MKSETVGSKLRTPIMVLALSGVVMSVLLVTQSAAQAKPSYQTGTIMQVKEHPSSSNDDNAPKKYDISVRVGNTLYVVAYEPPPGNDVVEYKSGISGPVLIEGDTMKFSDLLGNTKTLPIVSRKQLPPKKAKDSAAAQ
jgi:hypothetical protein